MFRFPKTLRQLFLILAVIGLPLLGGTFLALPAYPEAPRSITPQPSYEEQLFSELQFEVLPVLPEAEAEAAAAFEPEMDALIRRWQRDLEFSGTVLVARGGNIVHAGAYGYANRETKDSLQLGSVFQLASVTKMFTATAIMMLYDEKRLRFDDPIVSLVSSWPYPEMTIRHLLAHQSGLPRYDAMAEQDPERYAKLSNREVLEMFLDKRPRLNFRPGSDFEYNNSNYVLLAALVEYLAHEPFEEYLENRVFKPLGMTNTYFCTYDDRIQRPNHTRGYRKIGRRHEEALGDPIDAVFGDKGLHSNVLDLYRFDRALAGGRVLNPGTMAMAYEPVASSGKGRSYGFGVRMRENWLGLAYHFGWWRGYRTAFIRDLQADQTVIVLSNHDNPNKTVNFWDAFFLLNDWR